MPVLRLFASAREAAGVARDDIPGSTVAEVLVNARSRYGAAFGAVLENCRIWVDGEAATEATVVSDTSEVAVLPPVSGG